MVSLQYPSRVAISGLTLLLCVFVTVYCWVILKTGLVYTHLFYFPIILISAWWQRKGILLTFCFVVFFLSCNLFFTPYIPIVHNVLRTTVFLFISILTSTMFERRKLVDEELRASEKNWSDSFNSLEDTMIICNKDYTVEKVNDNGLELFKKTREEVVGKKCYQVFYGYGAPDEFCPFKRTLKTGNVESIERYIESFDKHFENKISPIFNEYGEIVGFVDLIRDITERKQMEETLRESEEKFRSISENISDWIWEVDEKGRYIYVSPVVRDLLGYEPEEVLGKTPFDFMPKEEAEKIRREFEKIASEKRYFSALEKWNLHKNGKRVLLETSGIPLLDTEGELIGYRGIDRDITARKRMEEELRDYAEHLEELVEARTRKLKEAERLAAIGETAAMVGHDLRNPLQAIYNWLYLEKEKWKSIPTPDRKILERHGLAQLEENIIEQVKYMNKIISDLQDYARPLKPKPVETSLGQLIDDVLSTVTIPETVQVSTAIEDGFPKLMVDPAFMRRMFTNLITNALQAMPEGGRLTIRASKTEETASIIIQDTGVGIPEEDLPKLFQPLFTTKPRGQGLGLPVCRRLVEAHNGSITVESQVDRGSTFTVQIPLERR